MSIIWLRAAITEQGFAKKGEARAQINREACAPALACRIAYLDYLLYMYLWSLHADMSEDIVKELGYLALGTRFKRLGERLQSQSQLLLDGAGIELPASHFPFLAALERLGPLSVGELSDALGVSQPGVTRMLEKLSAEGLVSSRQLSVDRRVRTIALSRSGRQLIARAKRVVWPRVAAAVADACAGPAQPLLAQLAALEEALAAAPLNVRAERLRPGSRKHATA